jgi:ABC-type phosphate transport system substrate-binding protein
LCNDKGSYQPNTEALISQRYPLAYPLTIVYPRDNRRPPVGEKFAEMLKTTEAQRLLAEAGLIPLQPLGE